jgi:hypothetical protein
MSTIKQDINSSNCHKKLNRAKISRGVAAMMKVLNLDAESVSAFNLIELNQAYILDLYKRWEINDRVNGTHEKLVDMKIRDGVVAMRDTLNLAAGSAGDLDLYKVNIAYLLNPEAREELDSLLKGW